MIFRSPASSAMSIGLVGNFIGGVFAGRYLKAAIAPFLASVLLLPFAA